jgi:hypothetical protein
VSGAKLNTGSGGVVVGAWLISIVAHGHDDLVAVRLSHVD